MANPILDRCQIGVPVPEFLGEYYTLFYRLVTAADRRSYTPTRNDYVPKHYRHVYHYYIY